MPAKFNQEFMLFDTPVWVEGTYYPEVPSAYFEGPGRASEVEIENVWVKGNEGQRIEFWEVFCRLPDKAKDTLHKTICEYFDQNS